jgi:MFS family permease
VPSNIILKRVGPRFWIPALVVGFGIVTIGMAFVKSYEGLLAARAILGIFEGGTFPGIAFYLSSFYKRKELLFRIGIYVSAASLAGAFGGLLAAGLSKVPEWGAAGARLHQWRNIFFFEGIITVIIGSIAPFFLPASPSQAKFLTEREQRIAAERLLVEHRENPEPKVELRHIKRAFLCLHNYTCALGFFLINITVQGLSVFMPTIIADLKIDVNPQLLTVPPYVAACLVAVLIAYISDKTKRRGIYLAVFAIPATIGFALLRWYTDKPSVRYMAVFFVTIGAFPGGPAFLSWAINSTYKPTTS